MRREYHSRTGSTGAVCVHTRRPEHPVVLSSPSRPWRHLRVVLDADHWCGEHIVSARPRTTLHSGPWFCPDGPSPGSSGTATTDPTQFPWEVLGEDCVSVWILPSKRGTCHTPVVTGGPSTSVTTRWEGRTRRSEEVRTESRGGYPLRVCRSTSGDGDRVRREDRDLRSRSLAPQRYVDGGPRVRQHNLRPRNRLVPDDTPRDLRIKRTPERGTGHYVPDPDPDGRDRERPLPDQEQWQTGPDVPWTVTKEFRGPDTSCWKFGGRSLGSERYKETVNNTLNHHLLQVTYLSLVISMYF